MTFTEAPQEAPSNELANLLAMGAIRLLQQDKHQIEEPLPGAETTEILHNADATSLEQS